MTGSRAWFHVPTNTTDLSWWTSRSCASCTIIGKHFILVTLFKCGNQSKAFETAFFFDLDSGINTLIIERHLLYAPSVCSSCCAAQCCLALFLPNMEGTTDYGNNNYPYYFRLKPTKSTYCRSGIYISMLVSVMLVSLYRIQSDQEDPCDGSGVDDLDLGILAEPQDFMTLKAHKKAKVLLINNHKPRNNWSVPSSR